MFHLYKSGKEDKFKQFLNKLLKSIIFFVSQSDNLGIDDKDEQPSNIPLILVTFFMFQLEISGRDINDVQFLNISLISYTFSVFHFEITSKEVSKLHSLNKFFRDEQDVQKDIDHNRDNQKMQGSAAVAECTKHGGAQIVQHGCPDAHEDEEDIAIGIVENLLRGVHQAEQIICPEEADQLNQDGDPEPEPNQLRAALFDDIRSSGPEALCNRDGKAGADPEGKPDDQEIQSPGHTNTGKGVQTQDTTDENAVGEVIKLLKQVPDQQWNAEAQNALQRRTCCHIFYHG